MRTTPAEIRKVAEQSVRLAGSYLRLISFEQLRIFKKGEEDITTNYDLESERLIKNHIMMYYPDHVIIAEESANNIGDISGHDVVWYVDPLDGTKAFLRGDFGMVSMSVAAWDKDGLIAGTVYNPFIDILYSAARGEQVLMNGLPLQQPVDPPLNKARILIDFSGRLPKKIQYELAVADVHKKIGRCFRVAGGISQHMMLIAQGTLHGGVFWGIGRKGQFWDIAAATLILNSLNIKVTNLEGKLVHPTDEMFDQLLIGPSSLHKELLSWVKDIRKGSFSYENK